MVDRSEGIAAEDNPASGRPVLTGGRYDSTDRSLESGDIGAIAVDSAGRILTVPGKPDGPSNDAFGRARVSNPVTIFESKLLGANDGPLYWDESLESGAGITASTPTANKPYVDFTSTDVTAGTMTRQTFRRFNYQPGKSQMILMTGVLELSTGTATGVERRIGAFDDDNGAFFESDAGTIGVTLRSSDSGSPVDTTVSQASWNLDTMDGSGPSGVTLDFATSQIFVIDYQWLAVGRVRFGVEINGQLIYVHQHSQTNESAIPWSSTPNLPLRYQMITTSSSGVATMRCICAAVISEGGADALGTPHSESTTDHVDCNVADTIYALVGVRVGTGYLGCTVVPKSVSLLSETNDDFEWLLIHNPTVAGTFTYSAKTNSCTETAKGATANTVTNGVVISRGFGAQASVAAGILTESNLRLGHAIDNTQDTVVLCARPLGTNADIQGALNWRELS